MPTLIETMPIPIEAPGPPPKSVSLPTDAVPASVLSTIHGREM